MEDVLLPFATVLLAELGDKTQLAVFCLAIKTRKRLQLLLGIVLAFIIADGIAVILGDFLARIAPYLVKTVSGIIFILCGLITLVKRDDGEDRKYDVRNSFISGFGLVLISEMGDKTQIVSGLFAAKYNPLLVFIGAVSALALLSAVTIYLGKYFIRKLDEELISKIAAIVFILIGILNLLNF